MEQTAVMGEEEERGSMGSSEYVVCLASFPSPILIIPLASR
jgi:hypothetical protein